MLRVGLEVHVYLRSRSKLFCGCPADFLDAEPNANICPICTGQPGAKPMAPNRAALIDALRIGHALGSTLDGHVEFQRKHYFYPDQPVNYQRTSKPIAIGGRLATIRIREAHVEEDPGAYDPDAGTLDLNRAGSPLLEIVTEPDIDSPEKAEEFLDELRCILEYLDAYVPKAGFKADVNVSVAGGERVEVKNVHSIAGVLTAIRFEEKRLRASVAAGESSRRETRAFDEASGSTRPMRTKETSDDYRYMSDPDLPAFQVPAESMALIAREEPPLTRRARLAWKTGVTPASMTPVMRDRSLVDAFETVAARVTPSIVFPFFLRDLRAELDFRTKTFRESGLSLEGLASLLHALEQKSITPHVATRILRESLDKGGGDMARSVEAEMGSKPDAGALEEAVRAAIEANPKAVQDFRRGKATAFNFLLGQLLKTLKGRAKPEEARAALERALGEERG
ncbi:MAG: Asp-tRNA(Asn)/Glu-tRNA(Gln) amidotransferase subunit GatB [Thermoplasmatota archaeon]